MLPKPISSITKPKGNYPNTPKRNGSNQKFRIPTLTSRGIFRKGKVEVSVPKSNGTPVFEPKTQTQSRN